MMKTTDIDHVFEQTAEDADATWPVGFYFSDETEQLDGPYTTKQEASAALDEYCRWYL